MSFSNPIAIEQTDMFAVYSYGNGAAYELIAKDVPGYRSAFLQGDDAAAWREQYDAMAIAADNPRSVWYKRTWNACLSELICDYLDGEAA